MKRKKETELVKEGEKDGEVGSVSRGKNGGKW